MAKTFSVLQKSIKLETVGLNPSDPAENAVDDRNSRLPGYQQDVIARMQIGLIGCGGLGGEIAHGLVRNGTPHLILCDHDQVELSNLNRQKFYQKDLYLNKAVQLAKNIKEEAIKPAIIEAYGNKVQDLLKNEVLEKVSLLICGVDNQVTRVDVARFGLMHQIPVIFTAVNDTADYGYVYIQESKSGTPCFGCLFPDAVRQNEVTPCTTGSSIDILKTVAGLVIYASFALFLPDRALFWRYKDVTLSGKTNDGIRKIGVRINCPLCGGAQRINLRRSSS
jgi:molybdopterin/thiamine biosynthesis adenylyltransferase